MLTREQARALVVAELARLSDGSREPTDWVVVDEHTIGRDWGWVFFWNSKRYLETRDFLYQLGGNAPFIVNRRTSELCTTGTAHPIEHYVAEYERLLETARGS